ncbi:hypothetical protein RIF29_39987 [Crotalaria pallida]|uniref:C2H2-type domain-containing protein n=1 Tax=Crotalaria pallida TaxID=3830 RepID=A0AAN9E8K6_CROPI
MRFIYVPAPHTAQVISEPKPNPNPQPVCDLCGGITFSCLSDLNYHFLSVHGDMANSSNNPFQQQQPHPYKCDMCADVRIFSSLQGFNDHMIRVHGFKP